MWLLAALLLFLTGCSTAQDAITGPNMVSGQEQGSLTVRCHYDSYWKNYKKYWCRGADWSTCETLVKTDTSEKLVKNDRVSIRDDQTDFIVTVTMEELRISDTGIYWCAIEKTGYDPYFKVNVTIDLAPEISTVILTTMAPVLTSTQSTRESISNHGETQTSTLTCISASGWSPSHGETEGTRFQKCRVQESMEHVQSAVLGNRSLLSSIYFNILVFLELPLLLSMLSAVL